MRKLALAALLALAACGRAADARSHEIDSYAAALHPADDGAPTVAVTLREWTIELPRSVSAGEVRFVVTNTGHEDHAFRITGPGVDASTRVLEPALSAELTVTLQPGRYHVECPVKEPEEREDHAALGMTGSLLVRD